MKFLIADDHELFLQGLEFILKKEFSEADIVLANSYTAIFEILNRQQDFDLIITDLAMPGANWLEAINKMHQICCEVPIIVISAVFDREILQKTYDIGVSGYISKSSSNNVIMSAIKLVMAGGMYITPELLHSDMKDSTSDFSVLLEKLENSEKGDSDVRNKESDATHGLTPRQMDVLQCLAEGLSNKQIAYKLGLSEGTVKIHITLLMRTLKVTNRVAAVREATKNRILNADT